MNKHNVSLMDHRQAIADNGGALRAADTAFFENVEKRYEALKNRSNHPADFRRLSNELRNWVQNFISKPDWKEDRDGAAYRGAMGWVNLIDHEMENRAALQRVSGEGGFGDFATGGWFDTRTRKPVAVLAPNEKLSDGVSPGINVGGLMAGMLFGPRDERVRAALEEGTGSAGGYTVPAVLMPEFIDKLRAQTRFVQAGARTVVLDTLETKIARVDSDPVAAWRAENTDVAESDPTFGIVTLEAKSLAVLVKVSIELLQDSVNIDEILQTVLINAMALELDRAAFFGSGTGNQPLGLFNISGMNSVSMGANGAAPSSYDPLIDAIYELEVDNAGAPSAAVFHPRTAKTFRKLKDSQNNPLQIPDVVKTLPMLTTTSVPINQTQGTSNDCSSIITGDFSQAMLGIRQQLVIQRLDQTFAKSLQVGFLASLRADVAFAHPESFCKIIGIKP